MKLKSLVVLSVLFALSGCTSTIPLTKDAQHIHFVPRGSASLKLCRTLGEVRVLDAQLPYTMSVVEMRNAKRTIVRNFAAKQYPSADTVVLENEEIVNDGVLGHAKENLFATALKCQW